MGIISSLDNVKFIRSTGSVVLCHGVFDVLHDGHLNYFEEAKKLGKYLVVSVTEDRYVNKGPSRPYFDQKTRARMLAALNVIDYVILNTEPKACNVIKAIRPSFYVKGAEYKIRNDVTKGIEEEEAAIKEVGGEMVYIDAPTNSSSKIINSVLSNFSTEQSSVLNEIKSLGGMDKISECFDKIKELYITVAGEPIVDTYVFCVPEGISSKSPTISARYSSQENYAGGSLAIANHIVDFVKELHLHTVCGHEQFYQSVKKASIDKRIINHETVIADYTTPRKTRFIDKDKSQRVFELTNINDSMWSKYNPSPFLEEVKESARNTRNTLLCDFGHGLFEGGMLVGLSLLDGFVALNCQTNSSNFGFNPYLKHTNYHYLSLDYKEARVAFHDRHSDAKSLFAKIKCPKVSMTLGPDGAIYKDQETIFKSPSFADKVIDAIGAGDAYYAITSLLIMVDAPLPIIPFVGNIFAGLKTGIIGNKHPVTKEQLFKTLNALLK